MVDKAQIAESGRVTSKYSLMLYGLFLVLLPSFGMGHHGPDFGNPPPARGDADFMRSNEGWSELFPLGGKELQDVFSCF